MIQAIDLIGFRDKVLERGLHPPETADLLYLVAGPAENQESVLQSINFFPNVDVGLIGHENIPGYPGFETWKNELIKRGVEAGKIIPMVDGSLIETEEGGVKKRMINTRTEMEALIRYLNKYKEIRDVVLVAPEFHLPRAFLSAVAALHTCTSPFVKIFPMIGGHLSWDEIAAHNQGTHIGRRVSFIYSEEKRIVLYAEKGDIASPRRGLNYLENL